MHKTPSPEPATFLGLSGTSLGVASALVTLAIWTSWLVGTRAAVSGPGYFTPNVLVLIRFGFTALVLLPVLLRKGFVPKGLGWPVLAGLMLSGSPYLFLVSAGLKHAPIADVGPLLPGTVPLMVAALSALILREKFSPLRLLGLGLIASGIVLIVTSSPEDATGNVLLGHALILSGALAWAVYTITLRASGLSGLDAAAFVAFWSFLLPLPFMMPFLPADLARAAQAPLSMWLAQLVIQGVLAGLVALLTFATAVRWLGPSRTAAITGLTPVTATIAGIPILGEIPTLPQAIACTAIVIGVALVTGAIGRRR